MLVSSDDQVKAYIKKIMSQLDKWMVGGKISKLVVVITSKDTGEHVERWQFDVQIFNKGSKKGKEKRSADKENVGPEYVYFFPVYDERCEVLYRIARMKVLKVLTET